AICGAKGGTTTLPTRRIRVGLYPFGWTVFRKNSGTDESDPASEAQTNREVPPSGRGVLLCAERGGAHLRCSGGLSPARRGCHSFPVPTLPLLGKPAG